MNEDALFFLILTSVEGLGCRGAHRLLAHYPAPSAIFSASLGDLMEQGVPEPAARSLLSQAQKTRAEEALAKCLQNNVQMLTVVDRSYPAMLKEIYDPPITLFVKGDVAILNSSCVAMVGSRRATPYGINAAEKLARDLAERGLTICSGLARGIDSAAHRGALEVKGKTIAVLGSGLDCIYPRENKKMALEIERSGCVISEFPLGTSPSPQNFPIRNRIISGLSLGTCLVEAAEFSGSLITARLALEQGREVFAVPGNVTSRNSFGPNLWIKQGAKLVQNWEDIVEELPRPIREKVLLRPGFASSGQEALPFPAVLTEAQKFVLELLRDDAAVHIDELLESSRLTSSELLSLLSELEMKDKIKQLPGKHFVRRF